MVNLADSFLDQIKTERYWHAGETVVIGVSGGVDSMVLFELLNHLPAEYKPHTAVAYVNHHLRKESDEEENFIKAWMKKYDVPVYTHQWPESAHPDSGVEEAARKVRYQFFHKVAEKTDSHIILTAHHQDDQVETVLMRLVRGSSLEELTGIPTVRREKEKRIIRLLLPYSKTQILNYAKVNEIPWKEDESNRSLVYTRNRYRNDIIPALKKENTSVERHIREFSNDIRDLLEVADPLISKELSRSFRVTDRGMQIDLSSLLNQEAALQKIMLRRAFKKLSGQKAYLVTRKHIDLLLEWFVTGGPNTVFELPGRYIARKEYAVCRIEKEDKDQAANLQRKNSVINLAVDQWKELDKDEQIGLFSLENFKTLDSRTCKMIYLNKKQISLPLIVRHRKPGDKMKVKGLGGSKKLKDMFIDQKVPQKKRDEAWIIADSSGEIIWVPGYKESPLSLDHLTDTISYVLVYQQANND
ncbi:MAG: tRNA lysidine(34) synthetase TilS [Alkalibacterium sp.]|nr:tRNA lysidine(34) synthetase TilS [Alkalibacterium sp.]